MILSAVIEEVDFLMSQRVSNYFLIVHNCWEISLVLKCIIHSQLQSKGTFQGQRNAACQRSRRILCCYNKDCKNSWCVCQSWSQLLLHRVQLINLTSILQPLQRDGVSGSCGSGCEQIEKCYHWDLKCDQELLPRQPQVCFWEVLRRADGSC